MKKTILPLLTAILLLVGCQQTTNNLQTPLKESVALQSQQQKVSQAFSNANDLQEQHSKWFSRNEKLPLTIIATAYLDPDATDTMEYKEYIKIIKSLTKDNSILGKELNAKYSTIKFINFDTNENAMEKFNAAYEHRYSNKEKLSDILRPDIETPSQELLIRLNLEELNKGNLTIEGYKTVKQKNKKRNSYYYTLRKTNYKNLNAKQKKRGDTQLHKSNTPT